MAIRIGKKLIWIMAIVCVVLAVVLIVFYCLGYFNDINKWQTLLPDVLKTSKTELIMPVATVGPWIVKPDKDYSGKTLVAIQNNATVARVMYQSDKLPNGYEVINLGEANAPLGLSSRFIIFNLPFSDTNELPSEAINKYKINQPFEEIYYCVDLAQPLTLEYATQLASENNLKTVCKELNGFLF
jgi:hypothetical protein